jgi:ATP-dependent helicase HrpA
VTISKTSPAGPGEARSTTPAKILPVHGIRGRLIEALTTHRVVVVEGPTGCGKTTQVPQMLADSALVPVGMRVGVTQPRRIAAVSVAWRIAKERAKTLDGSSRAQEGLIPGEVGYAIRFDDQTVPETRIRIMTDGILLQEARSDPNLSSYAVIMVDEAHERTLNIDFTLGLLRELLDRRDDLRVVISSATLNARAFTRFFGDCPRIEVEAMNYPVEVLWRPIIRGERDRRDDDEARTDAFVDTIERIHLGLPLGDPGRGNGQGRSWRDSRGQDDYDPDRDVQDLPPPPLSPAVAKPGEGDILAFFSGENEIKAAMVGIEKKGIKGLEVLPLYGRMTREEQERVFDAFPGRRKLILATNIAETSITIDGVRFVIDLGLHKVPSYDPRSGLSALREEPISQASARQRLGRAGRTAPGVCVRLYDERRFRDRPLFPTEEILRMDLIEVVLRLIDLGVRDVERFPLVTPPPKWLLIGAIRELEALGAIDRQRHLTEIGRRMVPFPLAPRIARMVVEAADKFPDAMDEALLVGAILSARHPQILPPGEEAAAREAHKNFADPLGDVIAMLRMAEAYERARDGAAFCERNFLDETILSEVLKVRDQLFDIAVSFGLISSASAGGGRPPHPRGDEGKAVRGKRAKPGENHLGILQCVATAFPRQLSRAERGGNIYETATGASASIHPGSALFNRKPPYVVATEIVVTGRPWMRAVSVVEPAWIAAIDPELADRWGLGRVRKVERTREDSTPRAPEVSIAGERPPLAYRRGVWTLELPWERVQLLATAPDSVGEVEKGLALVATRDGRRFLGGTTLGNAMRLAPLLDLTPVTLRGLPFGQVLEPERDLGLLLRASTGLARPDAQGKGTFLALFSNGVGGFWVDPIKDIRTCVDQSRLALMALMDHGAVSDEDRKTFGVELERLEALAEPLGLTAPTA